MDDAQALAKLIDILSTLTTGMTQDHKELLRQLAPQLSPAAIKAAAPRFVDQQVLFLVTCAYLDFDADRARSHKVAFENLATGRVRMDSSPVSMALAGQAAGELFLELGFYEKAYSNLRYWDSPWESLKVIAAYRKSGQQITSLDQTIQRLVAEAVTEATRQVVHDIRKLAGSYGFGHWDNSLSRARSELSKMGFSAEETRGHMRPAYDAALQMLLAGHESTEGSWYMNELVTLYREYLGDPKKCHQVGSDPPDPVSTRSGKVRPR